MFLNFYKYADQISVVVSTLTAVCLFMGMIYIWFLEKQINRLRERAVQNLINDRNELIDDNISHLQFKIKTISDDLHELAFDGEDPGVLDRIHLLRRDLSLITVDIARLTKMRQTVIVSPNC